MAFSTEFKSIMHAWCFGNKFPKHSIILLEPLSNAA